MGVRVRAPLRLLKSLVFVGFSAFCPMGGLRHPKIATPDTTPGTLGPKVSAFERTWLTP